MTDYRASFHGCVAHRGRGALRTIVDAGDVVTGRNEAAEIVLALDEFAATVKQAQATIAAAYAKLNVTTTLSIARWTTNERPIRDDIEARCYVEGQRQKARLE
ncbi:hypothetical protein [Paraburkholderia tropica]|uniref:hypothetical protein n=1 Tax=Paraburkholderia tropica TaxID=92647 RepID=UPI002AAFAAC6|nr:hypothetical protein [Paraburkholderia tropica]